MMTCEIIAYSEDYETDSGYYVSVKDINNKEIQRKPLSSWQLVKSLSTYLIVRTEKSNLGDLEQPTIPELYQVELTYSVNKSAKSLFLKKETQISPNNDSVVSRLFLKNVDSGSCMQLPIPNEYYKDSLDIEIKKSKGVLITLKESVNLLKSGNCLGVFSADLTKRFLL